MSFLTQRKAELGDEATVKDHTAAYDYIENQALAIFLGADTEDREGRAAKYVGD